MLKLSDNPPMVPPGSRLEQMPGRWWLAHTKARAEKAFAFDLLERNLSYFLPMIQRVRICSGKKRRSLIPLFTSYVFINGDEEARYSALTTGRLCQVIPIVDQSQVLADLTNLERALTGEATLDPYPFAAVGERCRIASGPFRGLEGVIVQRNEMARLVLEVRLLGQGAMMEIDADLLEPVGEDGLVRQ